MLLVAWNRSDVYMFESTSMKKDLKNPLCIKPLPEIWILYTITQTQKKSIYFDCLLQNWSLLSNLYNLQSIKVSGKLIFPCLLFTIKKYSWKHSNHLELIPLTEHFHHFWSLRMMWECVIILSAVRTVGNCFLAAAITENWAKNSAGWWIGR